MGTYQKPTSVPNWLRSNEKGGIFWSLIIESNVELPCLEIYISH